MQKIVPELISDQYAFKPMGSTTCALIDLSYLQMTPDKCVFIDFSKAFGVGDHYILL
jgi:hypothetical protein